MFILYVQRDEKQKGVLLFKFEFLYLKGKMMDETLNYLKLRTKEDPKFTWEIVIVNDGSKDRTTDIALGYVKREGTECVRLLVLSRNRGKGGAIKRVLFVFLCYCCTLCFE